MIENLLKESVREVSRGKAVDDAPNASSTSLHGGFDPNRRPRAPPKKVFARNSAAEQKKILGSIFSEPCVSAEFNGAIETRWLSRNSSISILLLSCRMLAYYG